MDAKGWFLWYDSLIIYSFCNNVERLRHILQRFVHSSLQGTISFVRVRFQFLCPSILIWLPSFTSVKSIYLLTSHWKKKRKSSSYILLHLNRSHANFLLFVTGGKIDRKEFIYFLARKGKFPPFLELRERGKREKKMSKKERKNPARFSSSLPLPGCWEKKGLFRLLQKGARKRGRFDLS